MGMYVSTNCNITNLSLSETVVTLYTSKTNFERSNGEGRITHCLAFCFILLLEKGQTYNGTRPLSRF